MNASKSCSGEVPGLYVGRTEVPIVGAEGRSSKNPEVDSSGGGGALVNVEQRRHMGCSKGR